MNAFSVLNNNRKEIIFLNGAFLPCSEAKVPVSSPGFLYGWGLFETMRSYNDNIVYFDEHLTRIKRSCRVLDIALPYSLSRLKDIVERTVEANGWKDAYVRLTVSKGRGRRSDILVWVKSYMAFSLKKYQQGFSCAVSGFRQNDDAFFCRFKSANYLLYQLSFSQAKNKGFDESLILNSRGYICECSHANIFFVKHRKIFTPSLECGCLDGITRKAVFDVTRQYGIKIIEDRFRIIDLYDSDEAFLTNSLVGIMPLARVEERQIRKGQNHITRLLMREYKRLLHGSKKN